MAKVGVITKRLDTQQLHLDIGSGELHKFGTRHSTTAKGSQIKFNVLELEQILNVILVKLVRWSGCQSLAQCCNGGVQLLDFGLDIANDFFVSMQEH